MPEAGGHLNRGGQAYGPALCRLVARIGSAEIIPRARSPVHVAPWRVATDCWLNVELLILMLSMLKGKLPCEVRAFVCKWIADCWGFSRHLKFSLSFIDECLDVNGQIATASSCFRRRFVLGCWQSSCHLEAPLLLSSGTGQIPRNSENSHPYLRHSSEKRSSCSSTTSAKRWNRSFFPRSRTAIFCPSRHASFILLSRHSADPRLPSSFLMCLLSDDVISMSLAIACVANVDGA